MLAWQARWPRIGDVRGLGAMLAIELVVDPASKEPAPDLAAAVIDAALERGLILLKAGISGNCIRVLVPADDRGRRSRRGSRRLGRRARERARRVAGAAQYVERRARAASWRSSASSTRRSSSAGVRDAALGEELRVDARRGEARDRVQLVDDDLRRRGERRSRRAPSPRSRSRRTRRPRARRTSLRRLVGQARGDDQVHAAVGVLRVEVVPVGVRDDLADDRGDRLAVAEDTDLDLDARLELLDEHLVVVPAGERDGRVELLGGRAPSRSRPTIRAVQA